MLLQMTPEIQAVMNLQGDMIVSFIDAGLSEEVARDLSASAIQKCMTSSVTKSTVRSLYEAL